MAWQTNKTVAGVWIYRHSGSNLNAHALIDGIWHEVWGANREDETAMFTLLVSARMSGRRIAYDLKGVTDAGQYLIAGVSA